jgi:hypothetical protein
VVNRSGERIRLLAGAAAVCGLLVVQVALAGSGPGAGGPKATASVDVKKTLNSLQRQIDALKAQVGKPGPQGPQGPQGIPGIPGPGAISFDRQFPVDNLFHTVTTVNGLFLQAKCFQGQFAHIEISSISHGWGTKAENGALSGANVSAGTISATAGNTADLDVVAMSTAPVDPGKWTRIDANVIKGNACNVHAMVTPSSSVG